MKYFKLIETINTKEIGIYPQVIKTNQALEIQEFGLGFNEQIQKQFILPEPILQKNAIETTMISITAINNAIFLVLKNYFLDFLKDFIIADYQSWKIDAYHNKQLIEDYSLFHISYPSQKKLIDFEKSKFRINDSINNISAEKKFKNFHDYQTEWEKLIWKGSVITFDILYLDFSMLNLDLFRIINIDSTCIGYYVSERLKNAIEEQKFTGFTFQEIEKIDKKINVICK